MLIRNEVDSDQKAVHALNVAAFGSPAEADLVDALRQQAHPIISLVAIDESAIVGHILFSPVTLSGDPHLRIMSLAPMAVSPMRQKQGIGSSLVRAGLEQCRQLGVGAVVVLGHPGYYPRFGFAPAKARDIDCEYDAPEGAFMVFELQPGYLRYKSGTILYHAAFQNV